MTGLLEHDFVAGRQTGGQYRIFQFISQQLVPVSGHDGLYDEIEVRRRFDLLRPVGDCWIKDRGELLRLIEA